MELVNLGGGSFARVDQIVAVVESVDRVKDFTVRAWEEPYTYGGVVLKTGAVLPYYVRTATLLKRWRDALTVRP